MDKKKLTLPIKIIIIGFIIGLVVAGIGGVRELNADKTNKQRAKDALKASKEAVEKYKADDSNVYTPISGGNITISS